jgi:hypothetical protein
MRDSRRARRIDTNVCLFTGRKTEVRTSRQNSGAIPKRKRRRTERGGETSPARFSQTLCVSARQAGKRLEIQQKLLRPLGITLNAVKSGCSGVTEM